MKNFLRNFLFNFIYAENYNFWGWEEIENFKKASQTYIFPENSIFFFEEAFKYHNSEENWIKSRDKSFNVVIVNKILKPHNVDENEEKISIRKGRKQEFYNLIFHDLLLGGVRRRLRVLWKVHMMWNINAIRGYWSTSCHKYIQLQLLVYNLDDNNEDGRLNKYFICADTMTKTSGYTVLKNHAFFPPSTNRNQKIPLQFVCLKITRESEENNCNCTISLITAKPH